MTEEKPEKPKEPEPIKSLGEAEAELNELEKFEITPEQKQEIQELKQEMTEQKQEFPKGKKQCTKCGEWIPLSGYKNHVDSKKCKKNQEIAEGKITSTTSIKPFNLKDKLPREKTVQEEADIRDARQIKALIEQREQSGEGFTPYEKDQLNKIIEPLSSRQTARNEATLEGIEASRQGYLAEQQKSKDTVEASGIDAPSWKDVMALKRIQMTETKQQNDIAPIMALMNNQSQIQRESHANDKANQQQMFQMQLANQQQMFQFMVEQLKTTKNENSALGKIQEIKEAGKLLGLKKGKEDDDPVSKIANMIGTSIPHIPSVIKELKDLKNTQQQAQFQTPIPAQVISDNLEEQTSDGSLGSLPSPQDVGGENNSPLPSPPLQPTIAPPHLNDEQVKAYGKQNYITPPSHSPFVDIYDQANKMFIPKEE